MNNFVGLSIWQSSCLSFNIYISRLTHQSPCITSFRKIYFFPETLSITTFFLKRKFLIFSLQHYFSFNVKTTKKSARKKNLLFVYSKQKQLSKSGDKTTSTFYFLRQIQKIRTKTSLVKENNIHFESESLLVFIK